MKITTLALASAMSAFMIAGAFAQSAEPAPAKPAGASATRSAKSIECSKEADAKGLHGKERKKFRAECKKGK